MAGRQPETIQTLIDAEAEARQVVAEARKYREERTKEADIQAKREIELYREKREKEYQEEVSRVAGNTGFTAEAIAKDADVQVAKTVSEGEHRSPEVVEMLVKYVTTVDTSI